MIMTPKTTEFLIHVLVTTQAGEQEPQGFMLRVYGHKNKKIETMTLDVKSQLEKLQCEIL